MKKNHLFYIIFAAAGIIAGACKKGYITKTGVTTADSSLAYLKVLDAAPYFRLNTGAADSFNVFINNVKVNGAALSYNSLFPSSVVPGGTATNLITNGYLAVAPGLQTIRLTVAGVNNPDSIPILSFTKTLAAGKMYSLLVTDSIRSTRDSLQLFTQDIWTPASPGFINIRLAHLVLNDTAGKAVDLYSYARNGTLLTNLKPGQITPFGQLGYNIQTPDTFYITRSLATGAPATTPLSARTILAKLLLTPISTGVVPQRTLTLCFKGDANLTSGTRARSLISYINQ